jgi:hypothetical protein
VVRKIAIGALKAPADVLAGGEPAITPVDCSEGVEGAAVSGLAHLLTAVEPYDL